MTTVVPEVRRPSPVDVAPDAEDTRFYGVTTILGTMEKPGLTWWAAGLTADAALDSIKSLPQRIEDEGRYAVWDWLRRAQFRKPKDELSATELGTLTHEAAEQYAITGVRPDCHPQVTPLLDQFDGWLQRWQPTYVAAEVTVYSEQYGYAGTCDGFLILEGEPLIIDYKTTKKRDEKPSEPTTPYPEVGMQLAAYRYADLAAVWRPRRHEVRSRRYYLLGPDERAMGVAVPECVGGLVIHITPDHCHAYPVRCDEAIHTSFLYQIEAARWPFEIAKTVIGERLVHPSEAKAA